MSTHDPVNHPRHYTAHPSGVECITVTEHMNFNVGNAVKYLWRAGSKGSLVEDLRKARWYIDREVQRVERAGAEDTEKGGAGVDASTASTTARASEVAETPAPVSREWSERVETGALQFDDDWPGVFIRGDNAIMGFLPAVTRAISRVDDPIMAAQLKGLASLLASCDAHGGEQPTKIVRAQPEIVMPERNRAQYENGLAQFDYGRGWNAALDAVRAANPVAPAGGEGAPFDDMEGRGPCGGRRCFLSAARDGVWIHSSKSYDSCSVRRGEKEAD